MGRELAAGCLGLLVALSACRDQPPTPAKDPPQARAVAAPATAPAAQPADAKLYQLRVTPPAVAAVGGASTATISVTPRAPYKINLEYPMKLFVRAPQPITPATQTLGPADAATFSAEALLLRPSLTLPAAGTFAIEGELRFSVCTASQCELLREPVRWRASVR